jgi:hypothetical protein
VRQRLPRRLAAKKALVKRENQGNLAPVENGGPFFVASDWLLQCDPLFQRDVGWTVGAAESSPRRLFPYSFH